ncbi:hypothetical protein IWW42_005299 [Coemansia sp. RSA 1085]|nr:hypothetical protein IWW42_005299 [Coemansia sp. RSA 1085]
MSFKFNFGVGEDSEGADKAPVCNRDSATAPSDDENGIAPYESIALSIPPVSSIVADALYCQGQRLWKRQIDDVQFQLAQQDTMDGSATNAVKQAIDSGSAATDVIKNQYEGGLKTWECAIDLLGYLINHHQDMFAAHDCPRVLEIGCGTALPSLYLLSNHPNARVCLQDYNKDVIELITLPNVLVNTALAPNSTDELHASQDTECCEIDIDYRRTHVLFGEKTDSVLEERAIPELTGDEAKTADALIMQNSDIQQRCELVSGDWANFDQAICQQGRKHTFDIVLTSETIYDTSNYKRLHDLLASVLAKPDSQSTRSRVPMVLIAAKSIYFGLSGSVLSFEEYVKSRGIFDIKSIWNSGGSMPREILQMTWHIPQAQ